MKSVAASIREWSFLRTWLRICGKRRWLLCFVSSAPKCLAPYGPQTNSTVDWMSCGRCGLTTVQMGWYVSFLCLCLCVFCLDEIANGRCGVPPTTLSGSVGTCTAPFSLVNLWRGLRRENFNAFVLTGSGLSLTFSWGCVVMCMNVCSCFSMWLCVCVFIFMFVLVYVYMMCDYMYVCSC